MMQIVKIDPNEKYVLVCPEIEWESQMEEIANDLAKFLVDDMSIFIIYGQNVTIVPANQIAGYKVVEKEK